MVKSRNPKSDESMGSAVSGLTIGSACVESWWSKSDNVSEPMYRKCLIRGSALEYAIEGVDVRA